MTIDEAIKHCEEVIFQCKENTTCALEHEQLKNWLIELKNYKRKTIKPFDLIAAKSGKPVCTEDGRKARIICFDCKDESFPLVVLVSNSFGEEKIMSYDEKGYSSTREDEDILIMAPKKKEGWVNIYEKRIVCEGGVAGCSQQVYETKEEALKGRIERGYVTTIKIEWEA